MATEATSSSSSLLMRLYNNEMENSGSVKEDYGSNCSLNSAASSSVSFGQLDGGNKLVPLDVSTRNLSFRDNFERVFCGCCCIRKNINSVATTNNNKEKAAWSQTLASVTGNILEWYDFALFGYFGDVIGTVFFPPDQAKHMAIVESFAVFGGAFLMRPLGGIIMGYIGDLYGRKLALILSIFLMAFPTFAMGLLPGYQRLGPYAIIILLLVRLLQGLSAGGQMVSSLVYTVENHPYEQWGLYGSFVMATGDCGTLLGGIAGFTIRATLTNQQVYSWGWRFPFLLGILVCFSGMYLRSHSYENEDEQLHQQQEEEKKKHHDHHLTNPLRAAFLPENHRSLLAAIMVTVLWSGGAYLCFVWMAIYMADLVDPPIPGCFAINSLATFLTICTFFCYAGHLSDTYGRKTIMTIGGICMGIFSPMFISIIGRSANHPLRALLAQVSLGVFLSLWGAPMCAWLVESFDPKARLTSVAIGYNVAHATAGGFSPALATYMVDVYGPTSPGYIISVLSVISLIGLWIVAPKETFSPEQQQHEQKQQQKQQFQKQKSKVVMHEYVIWMDLYHPIHTNFPPMYVSFIDKLLITSLYQEVTTISTRS